MVEHCIAFFEEKAKTELYRTYITDFLWSAFDGQKYGVPRYYEMCHQTQVKEERSSEEIVNSILEKIRNMKEDEET